MYSIFNSYLLKLTGTMAGLAFFSFALQAQEPVPADSVKAGQAEKGPDALPCERPGCGCRDWARFCRCPYHDPECECVGHDR